MYKKLIISRSANPLASITLRRDESELRLLLLSSGFIVTEKEKENCDAEFRTGS